MAKQISVELHDGTNLYMGPSLDSDYSRLPAATRFTLAPLSEQNLAGGSVALDTVAKPVERAYVPLRAGQEENLKVGLKTFEKVVMSEDSTPSLNDRSTVIGAIETAIPVDVVGPEMIMTY